MLQTSKDALAPIFPSAVFFANTGTTNHQHMSDAEFRGPQLKTPELPPEICGLAPLRPGSPGNLRELRKQGKKQGLNNLTLSEELHLQ